MGGVVKKENKIAFRLDKIYSWPVELSYTGLPIIPLVA